MPTPSSTKTTFVNTESTFDLDFDGIRLKLASPEDIHRWSHGEVTKPETINYRTQKPEKDGLFCERTFGPSKDWECYCGKYKRIRYKGIICDKCGVEVTRAIVRRERMGHIDLATPVSHIWFLRGIPSRIGLILDMSSQELEKVIYFASFIIISVNEELREQVMQQIKNELKAKIKNISNEQEQKLVQLNKNKADKLVAAKNDHDKKKAEDDFIEQSAALTRITNDKLEHLQAAADRAKKELKELRVRQIISEAQYQDLSMKYGHVFEASIGAEAVRNLLVEVDLPLLIQKLQQEKMTAIPSKMKKITRRLKLVKNLIANSVRPEWMILMAVPVIPPDLRPMVALDGGRFATSDLNDLYRRVINRNNRLKRLKELNAPEVIQRNEKRMLQEAVDALIDNNARRSKTVTASTGQKRTLKSIADMLKGKQGRFRQNLLGKRIDYSARSVIVAGPKLKIGETGIPKIMALELFKPFVISELIKREVVHNVRSANRYIEQDHAEVWDILEEVTSKSFVFLNRAPTLHRLGIQSFRPKLIEGKAIQVHPMVCKAFNADFDGDQMAVHVPLTEEAKKEAEELMHSVRNLLKPATGEPIIYPDQDIVWGCYYLTYSSGQKGERLKYFTDYNEAKLAYDLKQITLHEDIHVKINDQLIATTAGRLIFNSILPSELNYINKTMKSSELRNVISQSFAQAGRETTIDLLDEIKSLAYKYITQSGLSWGMSDIPDVTEKKAMIFEGERRVSEVQQQYNDGLLTNHERYINVIEIWNQVKNEITEVSKKSFDASSSLYSIIDSGARGSWAQLIQIMGMKGSVVSPAGEIIELPVKANFKEGLDVLEYFISTHGARKGLSDTALRTANAGYLTRRLVDVAQDLVISEEDCHDTEGLTLNLQDVEDIGEPMSRLILGRAALKEIAHPTTKKVIVKAGEFITPELIEQIEKAGVSEVTIRSNMTCKTVRGICHKCYGWDLGYNTPVKHGVAVGIVAAQSIGEPGTQLTMRTFHTGGVAATGDITQGLPRVEELFEGRSPKKKAIVATEDGEVIIDETTDLSIRRERVIKFHYHGPTIEEHAYNEDFEVKVKDQQLVRPGDVLMKYIAGETIVAAKNEGHVRLTKSGIQIYQDIDAVKDIIIPPGYSLWIKNHAQMKAGDPITEGSLDLQELYHYKGRLATEKYIIKEIMWIYSSQGQKINMKHIECIIRQMFSRVYIHDAGDTNLLPGDVVTTSEFTEENLKAKKEKKKEARGEILLLGITKASLTTDSWLSAASFQETARVLIDAAVTGKVDKLKGLKENVIIGRLIPAGTGYLVKRVKE
ncbi:MAG: DNA-directed RNA polymerase subunit beta' [Candidatus Komeilibacteria bacterium CG_4_10_14_0_2_um_filter_37_10]|uniref:DNA-directed RNA polymerase subunit beta' n=1 Tax=Candidatus Komeilibacteria bacterium CG_4_10_14_0_2_um_filter_37_10 TaxID=1974470 RepID=A0A2M7VD49_9BACT|nr:MAG: DNA-directed RNA polymerase subunit beta' [Candidatus Komeilibacteria bacterium CG_4_10_14_0_2_um_filter_37_10]